MAQMPAAAPRARKGKKVARSATSAPPNRGKHRLAQKDGLLRDVLLHGSTVSETRRLRQCDVVIAVIIPSHCVIIRTMPYSQLSIS